MQNLREKTKSIMVFSEVAYEEHSYHRFLPWEEKCQTPVAIK